MNNGKRIFISREQSEDSVFYKNMTSNGFEVYGESLIEFTAVPFTHFPEVDWIFFYSKNGVNYFLATIEASSHELIRGLQDVQFAAIGPGTAGYLLERLTDSSELIHSMPDGQAPQIDFTGDGNAESTTKTFLQIASGKKILFPRAKDSRRSVQQTMEGKAELFDLIVYENIPRTNVALPESDFLVFTSPLNAKAYFSSKKHKETQQVIAIGNTTAAYLEEIGITKVIISASPSEENLSMSILANSS